MLNHWINKLLVRANKVPVFKLLLPLYVCIAGMFAILIARGNMQLLQPAGYIANIQTKILWGAIAFAGIVATIVIGSFFVIVFRYKEDNHKAYAPDWSGGKMIVIFAWGLPLLAISVVSVLVWNTAHMVDPYKSISGTHAPVTIQVVALQWKWLFIYPNDHIASVNMLEIPAGTPVNLQLTADAPMNGFWVPRLSGQIAAMPGMVTQLHLEADTAGTYQGSPAELSGADFAGMDFSVKAVSASEYASWKSLMRQNGNVLNYTSYKQLAEPSGYNSLEYYSMPDPNLFTEIVMQFMAPGTDPSALQIGGRSL